MILSANTTINKFKLSKDWWNVNNPTCYSEQKLCYNVNSSMNLKWNCLLRKRGMSYKLRLCLKLRMKWLKSKISIESEKKNKGTWKSWIIILLMIEARASNLHKRMEDLMDLRDFLITILLFPLRLKRKIEDRIMFS